MSTPDAEDASPSPEYSGDQEGSDMAEQKEPRTSSDASQAQVNNGAKPVSNAKDPLRPRRKKARRACFACQRAHLTCGDERPCHRCIKRGLQDACADGVRKKAKYLHDAPPEALMPGVGGNYHHLNGGQAASGPNGASISNPSTSLPQQTGYYQQPQPGTFNVYTQGTNQSQMAPPMQDNSVIGPFSDQTTPISPSYNQNPTQQTPPMHNISNTVGQGSQPAVTPFGGPLFDPSDPALFNFDIASLNFGNHYGALEFGMLGHMASGSAETPPSDSNLLNPLNQAANMYNNPMGTSSGFDNSVSIASNLSFGAEGLPSGDWQNPSSRNGSVAQIQTPNNTPITTNLDGSLRQDASNGHPHAFAIQAGPSSLSSASPRSTGADFVANYESGNGPSSPVYFVHPNQQSRHPTIYTRQQQQPQQPQLHSNVAMHPTQWDPSGRRRLRDTSAVYETTKKPHSYTAGFHRLIEVVQRRFPQNKTLRVAKALASIRPSFIACTKRLHDADLVFMEQALQRTILTFDDFIESTGTPTLILRRTGEVVAVGKEFSILTGWRREVLLGKEPNLNVNTSGSSGNPSGASSRGGLNTPRVPDGAVDDSGPRPVSIAELLDEDSVVQLWENFARLAFYDSRGSVQEPCKLVKYRTKEEMGSVKLEHQMGADSAAHGATNGSGPRPGGKKENTISNEAGIRRLGESEGMVHCMTSWSIRRDIFDMPMLIVMNFLPIL